MRRFETISSYISYQYKQVYTCRKCLRYYLNHVTLQATNKGRLDPLSLKVSSWGSLEWFGALEHSLSILNPQSTRIQVLSSHADYHLDPSLHSIVQSMPIV